MAKDYSMYRFYRGETENPYFKELWASEVDKSHLPPPECMKYDFTLPAEKVEELSWKSKFWVYESKFEEDFHSYESSDWYLFFGDNRPGDNFKELLAEEDYERLTEAKKKPLFDLWLDNLFQTKLYPEYGGAVNYDKEAYYSYKTD
jgi:hypothetical protein